MLKLVSLTLVLTLATIVPHARSATFQTHLKPHRINSELHAQKLVPVKKSSSLRETVIFKTPVTTSSNKKAKLSPENKENQRIKTACQREIETTPRFSSNERLLSISENPNQPNNFNGFSNFSKSTSVGDCSFNVKF